MAFIARLGINSIELTELGGLGGGMPAIGIVLRFGKCGIGGDGGNSDPGTFLDDFLKLNLLRGRSGS